MTTIKFPVHESKTSDKVIRFTDLKSEVSKSYYAKIIKANDNGSFYGLYLTASGKIRAQFI